MPETLSRDPPSKLPEFGSSGRKIVYDENGKPCRTCNTLLDFRMVTQRAKPNANPAVNASSAPGSTAATTATTAVAATAAAATTALDDSECPPDVQQLGRSTWTLLHSIAATYPDHPTIEQKIDLTQFMTSFSKLYPCTSCARGLRKHMEKEKLKVTNRDEFGKWLCDAHNIVNVRTGKPTFDCQLWKERWKDGWKDGRCD